MPNGIDLSHHFFRRWVAWQPLWNIWNWSGGCLTLDRSVGRL